MLRLRPAQEEDEAAICAWLTSDDPLAVPTPTSADELQLWIGVQVALAPARLLIVELAGAAIGMVHLAAIAPGCAELSIILAQAWRGQGWAGPALHESLRIARAQHFTHLQARIRPDNRVSRRVFRRVGFQEVGEDAGGVVLLEYTPRPELG